jgi:hypothetical protein
VSNLVEALAAELERPRELSPRVLNYIEDNYSIEHDAVGGFLTEELPKLEDYEIDLILSPVFTPKLADQAVFAELLGRESVPRDEWPALVQQLLEQPTQARLMTLDGTVHSVTLREVTIERYVHRLRLEATIPDTIFDLLQRCSPTDQPVLKAIARRSIWDDSGRRGILERYLTVVVGRQSHALADAIDLLNLMENRKPSHLENLLAEIPRWQEALRNQVEVAAGGKPFFNEDVRLMHGGARDQRPQADSRVSAKENELGFLERLRELL